MKNSNPVRNMLVDGPNSLGERARSRRWKLFERTFPDIGEMSVIDLGGTVEYWLRAPIRPAHLRLINLEGASPEDPGVSWISVSIGDACDPGEGVRSQDFDLVYSNSVIEHVGGHSRREQFAQVVADLAERHWIQTPYRYFPIEPHWVAPALQFMPLAVRSRVALHWPLAHSTPANRASAVGSLLSTELLDITAMRHYFPSSEMVYERTLGLVKSVIAVSLDANGSLRGSSSSS